jgi:hypothetical protein
MILICGCYILPPVSGSMAQDDSKPIIIETETGWNYTLTFSPENEGITGPSGLELHLSPGFSFVPGEIPSGLTRYQKQENQLSIAFPKADSIIVSIKGEGSGTLTILWFDYENQNTKPTSLLSLNNGMVTVQNSNETTANSPESESNTPGFTSIPAIIAIIACITALFKQRGRKS